MTRERRAKLRRVAEWQLTKGYRDPPDADRLAEALIEVLDAYEAPHMQIDRRQLVAFLDEYPTDRATHTKPAYCAFCGQWQGSISCQASHP